MDASSGLGNRCKASSIVLTCNDVTKGGVGHRMNTWGLLLKGHEWQKALIFMCWHHNSRLNVMFYVVGPTTMIFQCSSKVRFPFQEILTCWQRNTRCQWLRLWVLLCSKQLQSPKLRQDSTAGWNSSRYQIRLIDLPLPGSPVRINGRIIPEQNKNDLQLWYSRVIITGWINNDPAPRPRQCPRLQSASHGAGSFSYRVKAYQQNWCCPVAAPSPG